MNSVLSGYEWGEQQCGNLSHLDVKSLPSPAPPRNLSTESRSIWAEMKQYALRRGIFVQTEERISCILRSTRQSFHFFVDANVFVAPSVSVLHLKQVAESLR